jgi:hypothetical protein
MDSRLVEIRHEPPLMADGEDRLDVPFKCNEKFFNVILSDRILPGFDGLIPSSEDILNASMIVPGTVMLPTNH